MSFWGALVRSKRPISADIFEECDLRVTNVCLAEPTDVPVSLWATLETIIEERSAIGQTQSKTQTQKMLVACFQPGEPEQHRLALHVGQTQRVRFNVDGTHAVYVSGYQVHVGDPSDDEPGGGMSDDDDDDSDEEEEEDWTDSDSDVAVWHIH
jgi:hypothetical protein